MYVVLLALRVRAEHLADAVESLKTRE